MIHGKLTYGSTSYLSLMGVFWGIIIYLMWINYKETKKYEKRKRK